MNKAPLTPSSCQPSPTSTPQKWDLPNLCNRKRAELLNIRLFCRSASKNGLGFGSPQILGSGGGRRRRVSWGGWRTTIPAPRRRSVPSPDLAGPSPTDDRSSVFTLVNQERRQLLLLRSVLVTTGSFWVSGPFLVLATACYLYAQIRAPCSMQSTWQRVGWRVWNARISCKNIVENFNMNGLIYRGRKWKIFAHFKRSNNLHRRNIRVTIKLMEYHNFKHFIIVWYRGSSKLKFTF
jgi:hypothetical protein